MLTISRILIGLTLFWLSVSGTLAQAVFRIDSLAANGLLLNKGWKFHAGDNPEWAKPDFDDSAWENIDPTKDIFELPTVQQVSVSWFRLQLDLDSQLAQQNLALQIWQTGASELYLDGERYSVFGQISRPGSPTKAFQPQGEPVFLKKNHTRRVCVAIRFGYQTNIKYIKWLGKNNPCLAVWLTHAQNINQNAPFHELATSKYLDTYKMGLFGVLSILHIALYFSYRKQKGNLLIGLFMVITFFAFVLSFLYKEPSYHQTINTLVWLIAFINVLAILAILEIAYLLFKARKSWIYYSYWTLSIASLIVLYLFYETGWVVIVFLMLIIGLEVIRIGLSAHQKEHKLLVYGATTSLIFYIIATCASLQTHDWQWIYDIALNISYLSMPISFSLAFALEFAFAHKSLEKQLQTVENLSAEKQQILANQNEILEVQVTERTAELAGKNRELEIEAALDRVRSRTMAMQKSEHLVEVINVVAEQLLQLNFRLNTASFFLNNESEEFTFWLAAIGESNPDKIVIPKLSHPALNNIKEAQKNGVDFWADNLSFEEKNTWFQHVFAHSSGRVPEDRQKYILNTEGYARSVVLMKQIGLFIVNYVPQPYTDAENAIFKRFAFAFEQAYTRFLDLQKAEEQAREAQIEAALERVRSASLAIHQSHELEKVVVVLFDKLNELRMPFDSAFIYFFEKSTRNIEAWVATKLLPAPIKVNMPYDESVANNPIIVDLWYAIENGEHGLNKTYKEKDKDDYYRYEAKHNQSLIPASVTDLQLEAESWTTSFASEKNSIVGFDSWNGHLTTIEDFQILKRFAKVFEQAYIRFLDLRKAEAQAREAQIEVALERVRGRTMAMQKSDELTEVAGILFKQVTDMGIKTWTAGFNVWSEDNNSYVDYLTSPFGGFIEPYTINAAEFSVFVEISDAKKRGEEFLVQYIEGDLLKQLYLELIGDEKQYEIMLQDGLQHPSHQYNHFVFGAKVSLMFVTYELVPETHDIFKRFGKVFEQTYTRFLDLQKAEAQLREAQIEAALDNVRSRSLAMQKSTELQDVVRTVVERMTELGLNIASANIVLFNEQDRGIVSWTKTNTDDVYSNGFQWPYNDDPAVADFFDAIEQRIPLFTKSYTFDEKNAFWKNNFERSDFRNVPVDRKKFILNAAYFSLSLACRNKSGIVLTRYAQEPFSDSDHDILQRFATVFEQAYTRFLDLQKAEANEREAIRQATLDRVRAEIASMRTTDDLERITPLIWKELTTLEVPFIRCGVFIMDDATEKVHTFLSTPSGHSLASFDLPYDNPGITPQVVAYWRDQKIFVDHWDAAQFQAWSQSLVDQGLIQSSESYVSNALSTQLWLYFLPFQQGMLYVGNTASLTSDAIRLAQALADAFSTAYARYQDFNQLEEAKQQVDKAFIDLKATQTQLIQKEKMASLGELTAGIAHEIQNPLNFVNNFSEVSTELVDELAEEQQKPDRDPELEAELLADLKDNLQKITHHGHRASSIVKGMLEHSRATTGERRPTDINALADEYLRLAYQGLRAKNKDFNADLKTDFAPALGKVEVVPQEIGRVLLNLFNNAFYAVQQKQKSAPADYQPTVTVSTKQVDSGVEIRVKDNGTGMPESVKAKIFQPFFTTKPTGEGTGLGLSLSYDIITKGHGGTLTVESKENEGTKFVISIPV